jgi:outer membrane murein-binding lipoprotein Lpp
MRTMSAIVVCGCCWLAGCSPFPDVPEPTSDVAEASDYPDFVPIDQISYDPKVDEAALETEETLEARVAGLKARAARLRRALTD